MQEQRQMQIGGKARNFDRDNMKKMKNRAQLQKGFFVGSWTQRVRGRNIIRKVTNVPHPSGGTPPPPPPHSQDDFAAPIIKVKHTRLLFESSLAHRTCLVHGPLAKVVQSGAEEHVSVGVGFRIPAIPAM